MKRARFSEEQIISILKEAEAGAKVHGTVPATRDLGRDLLYLTQEVRRSGGFRDAPAASARKENRRLKFDRGRPGAGHPGAPGRASKKRLRPAVKREMVVEVMAHGLSRRRTCGLIEITRRGFRHAPGPDSNRELRERLKALAEERRRSKRLSHLSVVRPRPAAAD